MRPVRWALIIWKCRWSWDDVGDWWCPYPTLLRLWESVWFALQAARGPLRAWFQSTIGFLSYRYEILLRLSAAKMHPFHEIEGNLRSASEANQTHSQNVFYSHHHTVAHRELHCDEVQGYINSRDLCRLCRPILSTALMLAYLEADFLGSKHILRVRSLWKFTLDSHLLARKRNITRLWDASPSSKREGVLSLNSRIA